jgi:ferritin-like metal-binding protein YciE
MASSRKSSRTRKDSPDGNELLVLELQEIHNAESQLSRVVPKLMKAVESEELRECLEERLSQGERLTKEIESALEQMDESPGRKKNAAAEGLINDTREHVQEIESGPALDAVLISGIQKTEHYCIAAWGTARSLGESAGEKEVVKSMERALKEGRQMDEALTKLAEETINPQVFAEESQDEESDEGTDEEGGSARSSGRGGKQQRQEQRTSR